MKLLLKSKHSTSKLHSTDQHSTVKQCHIQPILKPRKSKTHPITSSKPFHPCKLVPPISYVNLLLTISNCIADVAVIYLPCIKVTQLYPWEEKPTEPKNFCRKMMHNIFLH